MEDKHNYEELRQRGKVSDREVKLRLEIRAGSRIRGFIMKAVKSF